MGEWENERRSVEGDRHDGSGSSATLIGLSLPFTFSLHQTKYSNLVEDPPFMPFMSLMGTLFHDKCTLIGVPSPIGNGRKDEDTGGAGCRMRRIAHSFD